jgi:hypothetical protein
VAVEEQELAAQEPYRVGAVAHGGEGVVDRGEVGGHPHHEPVGGGGRLARRGDQRVGLAPLGGGAVEVVGKRLGGRIDDDGSRGAVDDEHRSVGNELRALYQGQGIGPDRV